MTNSDFSSCSNKERSGEALQGVVDENLFAERSAAEEKKEDS